MAEHIADKKDGWQRYDWLMIEMEYIWNPSLSVRGIARKYGCNIKTVAKHCADGHWVDKRKEMTYRVNRLALIKRISKENEQSVLDDINEERASLGLDPIDDIGDDLRDTIREELEKKY